MKLLPYHFIYKNLLDDIDFTEVVDELKDYDIRFFQIIRKHLAFLALTCIIELVLFVPALFFFDGAIWYFMIMTLSWACINYYVVLWIFDHILLKKFTLPNPFERFEAQRHVEKMMFINLGLDLAYIFAGLWFLTLGHTPSINLPELWKGFGSAVILQGFYLFIQDNYFHRLHSRNIRKALPFFKELMLSELYYRENKKSLA